MAKILTDVELLDIVKRTIEGEEIDCADNYLDFLTDLSLVITKYFGGTVGSVRGDIEADDGQYSYGVAIHRNDEVPDDGGIYKMYDTDVDWSLEG